MEAAGVSAARSRARSSAPARASHRRRPLHQRADSRSQPRAVTRHLELPHLAARPHGGGVSTSQGRPYGIFQRAIKRRNVVAARAAAHQLPQLSLDDALELDAAGRAERIRAATLGSPLAGWRATSRRIRRPRSRRQGSSPPRCSRPRRRLPGTVQALRAAMSERATRSNTYSSQGLEQVEPVLAPGEGCRGARRARHQTCQTVL